MHYVAFSPDSLGGGLQQRIDALRFGVVPGSVTPCQGEGQWKARGGERGQGRYFTDLPVYGEVCWTRGTSASECLSNHQQGELEAASGFGPTFASVSCLTSGPSPKDAERCRITMYSVRVLSPSIPSSQGACENPTANGVFLGKCKNTAWHLRWHARCLAKTDEVTVRFWTSELPQNLIFYVTPQYHSGRLRWGWG